MNPLLQMLNGYSEQPDSNPLLALQEILAQYRRPAINPLQDYGGAGWSRDEADSDLLRQLPPVRLAKDRQQQWQPHPQDLKDLEGLRGDNLQRAHKMLRERELRFKRNQEMRMRNQATEAHAKHMQYLQYADQYRQYPGKGQPSPWVSEEAGFVIPGAVLDAVRGGQWQPQYGPPGVH